MGSVLHPVGKQPQQVYWVRRGIVLAAVVAVLALLIWIFRPAPAAPVTAVPAPVTVSPDTPAAGPTEIVSPTPSGPVACDATNTKLSVAGYQKVKQGGKQPFRVTLANTSAAECELDLSASTFSLTVTSGSDQIWSTADCAKWGPAKKATLKAGKTHEFSIEWKLTRSSTGCKQGKDPVKPGTYVGKATFAQTAEARQVFQVQKKG